MMADGGAGSIKVPSLKRERDDDLETISTPQNSTSHTVLSGPPIPNLKFEPAASPAGSTASSSGLSDAPSTIASISPATKNAFTSLNGTVPPPLKKPKLTFQEKELDKQRKAQEKVERDQAKARRDAEKEENKRKAEAEREAKKIRLEAEREEKKIALEAEKAAKLEKKRQHDAEKAAKEEEKHKSLRTQKTLNSFFKTQAAHQSTPKSSGPEQTSGEAVSKETLRKKKDERSEYEKLFPPFFVKENVKLAPILRWERDSARLEFVQNTIDKAAESWDADNVTNGSDKSERPTFDAQELFGLPGNDFRQRGRIPRPVRDIMAKMNKPARMSIDSQNTQIKHTRSLLSTIPYKFLQFHEDVRPPYRGTFTRPLVPGTAVRLARVPTRRELPEVDYDYDSEAEWADEPGDDLGGEDLDSENEDEDADGPDDMDDFLDNSGEDELDNKQSMGMEPVSSGMCWEDRHTRNMKDGQLNKQMYRYQMEVIADPEESTSFLPIDPFSTKYWPQKAHNPSTTGLMNPPRLPLSISKSTNTSIKSAETTGSSSAPAKEKKLISPSEMQRFCDLVRSDEYNEFTKPALIDVLYAKFNKNETKVAIKNTLEAVAKKSRWDPKWVLKDGT